MQENLAPEEIMEISEWIKKSNDDQIKSLLINGSYDYNVDSVSLFDEMFSGLLSELNPNDAGIKGITGAGGKYITGIIDMDKLNAYIDNLRSNVLKTSYDAGYHSGHSTGETLGGAKGLAAAPINNRGSFISAFFEFLISSPHAKTFLSRILLTI